MISKSKQNWAAGNIVKVGFMQLLVVRAIPTPGDYLPDAYILASLDHTKLYRFVPHNGLEKIDMDEANQMIAEAVAHADKLAKQAIDKAAKTINLAAMMA